ncbi:hypothetical protein Lgra_1715 [Legionella gratiana]|uniref:Uncharacterized protein n=1 Tax=Legionella gratiana TaxID=45066 RepID=A0A378J9M6_9GAMM|nr:DUF6629 family protein [Legionella gratiana]KTD10749.1 hypothetical protein Lgra_1715 [Legionella gratiana]STX43858.1 Uncharacterised protein [Legionella gratiana]
MCFSASASFTAAGVLSAVGICSLLKARTYPLYLFAVTPLFFALQQALEGIVWITLMQGDSISLLNKIGVYGFLFFAGVFWPIWLSGCLYLLEDDKKRKKLLFIVFIIGIIAASKILFRLVAHEHTAVISEHHINYPMFALTYEITSIKRVLYSYTLDLILTMAYLIAVIVPFFISSIRGMWIIGAVTAIGFIVAAVFYSLAFGSVWCFFGALATIAIYYVVVNYNNTHLKG